MSESKVDNQQAGDNNQPVGNNNVDNAVAEAPAANDRNEMAVDQDRMIAGMIKENPILASDPEIAQYIKGKQEQVNAPNNETNEKNVSKGTTNTTTNSNNNTSDSGENRTDDNESESIFSKKRKKSVDLNNFEDAIAYIHNKYNIEAKGSEGLEKFFDSVNKWRSDSQKSTSLQRKLDDVSQSFENMPETLYNAFKAWTNGNDWTKEVANANSRIDFKKAFDDQDKYSIVNKYFPGEFEREDITDGDDPTVKKAVSLARRQYEIDRTTHATKKADIEKAAKQKHESLLNSVSSSVSTLKDEFPGFSDSHLKKVEKFLKDGNLGDLFYTETGSYRDDAATRLAFLLYGKEELSRVMQSSTRKGKEDALKEVVTRGSDRPNVNKNQATMDRGADELLKSFEGLFDKKYY